MCRQRKLGTIIRTLASAGTRELSLLCGSIREVSIQYLEVVFVSCVYLTSKLFHVAHNELSKEGNKYVSRGSI
jgi:hypothetical protein